MYQNGNYFINKGLKYPTFEVLFKNSIKKTICGWKRKKKQKKIQKMESNFTLALKNFIYLFIYQIVYFSK